MIAPIRSLWVRLTHKCKEWTPTEKLIQTHRYNEDAKIAARQMNRGLIQRHALWSGECPTCNRRSTREITSLVGINDD